MCRPLAYLLLLSSLAAQAPLQFTDQTAAAGIGWQQMDSSFLMGAGGAFFDADGDGYEDIILCGGDSFPGFYRNLQNGTFANETIARGLALDPVTYGYAMCVAVADIDSDGDLDLYLGYAGPNVLMLNDGTGTFAPSPNRETLGNAWTSGAAFGDFDQDGLLDLYVGNYIDTLNYPFHTPAPNVLYRNLGGGRFQDVSAATGTALAGTTLAVTWTDYDGDGDPDLMVANDFGMYIEPNRLFRNDGPGTGASWRFTEVASSLRADPAIYCMGIAPGDYDRDGDLDYYVSNLGTNAFLENLGLAGFQDVTMATGTAYTLDPTTSNPPLLATSWGVGFQDFDCDGWLDLFVANGFIPAAPNILNGTATPAALYHHDGASLTYSEVALAAGAANQGIGRGAAFADYDRDGDIDILAPNINGPPALLRNDSPNPGHFLVLRPQGTQSNSSGIGLRATLVADGEVFVREVNRTMAFESSSAADLHFGLGASNRITSYVGRWPSGTVQRFHDLPVDLDLPLVEPSLTQGPGSFLTPVLREGGSGTLDVVIQNHAVTAVRGQHTLSIYEQGTLLAEGATTPVLVPGSSSAVVSYATSLPIGSLGGQARNLELRLTIADSNGGLDQWRGTIRLRP